MGNILIFGEQHDGCVKKTTKELVAKASDLASQLGGQLDVVFIGEAPSDAADLGKFGAKKVTLVDPGIDKYNSEVYTSAVYDLIKESGADVILATASPKGKDFFPRLAARLDAGLASDCVDLRVEAGKLVPTRPIYSGKAIVDVSFQGEGPVLATTRPNSFVVEEKGGAAAEIVSISKNAGDLRAPVVSIEASESQEVDLTEAEIIISGGRSMKEAANFSILRDCAATIGATVGASRAAVDSGYAPHAMQVGQTGKVVNPNLYIACGISGAIQHLAGMRTSKVIVAINKDAEAPIFSKADYGIVGDLFEIVPLLTEELRKLKSAA
jgi:electron transfer flavoprotein alpha subunit